MLPDQRFDGVAPVFLVDAIDLGGHAELAPAAHGDLDGTVGPLLGRYAAEEGEVAALGLRVVRAVLGRQAVMDRRQPVGSRRHGQALIVGDRDQRHARKGAVDRHEVRHVEPTVHRGDALMVQILEHRVLKQVDVEVQDVELILAGVHVLDELVVDGDPVGLARVEADRLLAHRRELQARVRIAAGEQRHLMALGDQLFRQP